LRPVAFNPHGGSLTKTAQTLLELAEQSQKTQAAEEKIAAD
jgi:hypothetical protein